VDERKEQEKRIKALAEADDRTISCMARIEKSNQSARFSLGSMPLLTL